MEHCHCELGQALTSPCSELLGSPAAGTSPGEQQPAWKVRGQLLHATKQSPCGLHEEGIVSERVHWQNCKVCMHVHASLCASKGTTLQGSLPALTLLGLLKWPACSTRTPCPQLKQKKCGRLLGTGLFRPPLVSTITSSTYTLF
eukprot:1143354-Pelagomonas_calceolata.AAC.9